MTLRTITWIGLAGLLTLAESGCGSGAQIAPALSISTTALRDGMATFPYSQTITANGGVAPFVWSVGSGSLPHNVALGSGSADTVTLSGTPDTAQTAAFTIEVRDSRGQSATRNYAIKIAANGSLQVQSLSGQVPAGVVEIQGVSASPFTPAYWQQNTLNWSPDVRMPIFAARTTEIFDPATETFSSAGSMLSARAGAFATTLANGMVLITGGVHNSAPLNTAELFDPAPGTFTSIPMISPRRVFAASQLPKGRILLAGGNDASSTLSSTEMFDASLSSFTTSSSLTTARAYHTATQLADGKLLVAGGEIDSTRMPDGAQSFLSSAELFDPATGQFTATASMNNARSGHTATLLQSGEVLVTGGWNQGGSLSSAEVFSPK